MCICRVPQQVLERRIPLVGVFLNGEIGPAIKGGYVGWVSSEATEAAGASSSSSSSLEDSTQGDEGGLLRMTMPGEPSLCESQGWTSMFSMLAA